MRTLTIINWVLILCYLVFIIINYVQTNKSGIDPAGHSMAMGFLAIIVGFTLVLIILNLIPFKWVKIVGLAVGSIPILFFIVNAIKYKSDEAYFAERAEQNKVAFTFNDPHLNAMAEAMRAGDPVELKRLLEEDDSKINQVGTSGMFNLLDIAVQTTTTIAEPENTEMVNLLIQHKADPNLSHAASDGPLVKYALTCPTTVFEVLLKAGANPNAKNYQNTPILYTLAEYNPDKNYEKIKLLLEHGADPNSKMGDTKWQLNFSPLVFAASNKAWKVCNLLVNHGADPNFIPPSGHDFWNHFETSGKEYTQNGELPENYLKLKENEKLMKRE